MTTNSRKSKVYRTYLSLAIQLFGRPARQKQVQSKPLVMIEKQKRKSYTSLVDVILALFVILSLFAIFYADSKLELLEIQAFEVEHIHNVIGAQK